MEIQGINTFDNTKPVIPNENEGTHQSLKTFTAWADIWMTGGESQVLGKTILINKQIPKTCHPE